MREVIISVVVKQRIEELEHGIRSNDHRIVKSIFHNS